MPGSSSKLSLSTLREKFDEVDFESVYSLMVLLAISPRLRSALASSTVGLEVKHAMVVRLTDKEPNTFIRLAIDLRWSHPVDLLHAFEEVFINLSCANNFEDRRDFLNELFRVSATLDKYKIIDKALSGRYLSADSKKQLISRLFAGFHKSTLSVLEYFACFPQKKRSLRRCVLAAEEIVANSIGAKIADVIVASQLLPEQKDELASTLSRRFAQEVTQQTTQEVSGKIVLREIVDKKVLGGVRVQVGHSVADDTVSVHLNNLALSLKGS